MSDRLATVILLVGLPGAGKTTLARRLAPAIGATILNRDYIRDAIFPAAFLDYSTAQNAVATGALLEVVAYILGQSRRACLIIDGKPFARRSEIEQVRAIAEARSARLAIIHCDPAASVIDERLRLDPANLEAPEADRTPAKAARIRGEFEPIDGPHLRLDTAAPLEVLVARCVSFLRE